MSGVVAVAGADGCPGGWVVALADPTDEPPDAARAELRVVDGAPRLVELVTSGEVSAVAIDIPIGLPDIGPRRCDREARALLGPRRSSVFPAPARRYLRATRFGEVQGMSIQAFHLVPKIADVDRVVTPEIQRRVVESHPELAFARLAGHPMPAPKKTATGRRDRSRALRLAGGDVPKLAGARADDVLDALALVHTAWHIARGSDRRLGGDCDRRGLRMEIAW